jgi:protein SCO1/2
VSVAFSSSLRRSLLPLLLTFCACGSEALPVLTEVPNFTLTRESGAAFSSAESLRGHVWIANFIFTTCPSICPTLTSQMGNLERRTRGSDIRFVSFSVDPETDTPEVLTRYARTYDANLERWTFLTGDASEMRTVIEEGLRMRMGERADGDILHGGHFVLVDASGHVRGFYRNEGPEQERLEQEARRLSDSD